MVRRQHSTTKCPEAAIVQTRCKSQTPGAVCMRNTHVSVKEPTLALVSDKNPLD